MSAKNSTKALPSLSPLLTKQEAAQVLGIGVRALDALTANGLLPCVRMPKAVRFAPEAIKQFIDRGGMQSA